MKNKKYKTIEIKKFYSNNRNKWNQLYKSEKEVIKKIKINRDSHILDIGSACGGLGIILKKKFKIKNYTGLEINKQAYKFSKKNFSSGKFINKDLLDFENKKKNITTYDYVFSLGCIDWNTALSSMLKKSWKHVKENGYLVITLRFLDKKKISSAYQYINFNNRKFGEKAKYHILNFVEFKKKIKRFKIKKIVHYGYWSKPNVSVITKYKKIFFVAIAIKKGVDNKFLIKNFVK